MKAKIWNKSWWISETREKEIDRLFGGIIKKSGFNVLDTIEHEFYPFGYTKIWLLSESHFAVHTFPEESKAYIELSSCNEEYYNNFLEIMAEENVLTLT